LAANTGFFARKEAEDSHARRMGDGFGEQGQFIVSGCAFNRPQVQLRLRFRCGAAGRIEFSFLIHRLSSIADYILPHILVGLPRTIDPPQRRATTMKTVFAKGVVVY
jgi:hypothetical protein